MNRSSGVYAITNAANGKRYIGSAVNFRARQARHIAELRTGKHHSQKLQRAWEKYGAAAFIFEPLLVCAPRDVLFYEERCIAAYDAVRHGYNACHRARNAAGVKRSPAFRARMSAVLKARVRQPQELERLRRMGRELRTNGLAPAARAALVASNKHRFSGVPLSEEHKAKLSFAMRDYKPSPQAAEATRRARTGKPLSAETRARMSVAHKGRVHSAESRAKISAGKMGHEVSPETRAKISSAKTLRRMAKQAA